MLFFVYICGLSEKQKERGFWQSLALQGARDGGGMAGAAKASLEEGHPSWRSGPGSHRRSVGERGDGSEGKWECHGWAERGHLRARPQQLKQRK